MVYQASNPSQGIKVPLGWEEFLGRCIGGRMQIRGEIVKVHSYRRKWCY